MANPQPPRRPRLLYGTAFKFDKSSDLTLNALQCGFRGFDTAGSSSAYREDLVGRGLEAFLNQTKVTRGEIFIQTKFSPFKAGRDPKIYPYDTTLEIESQVSQSFRNSCKNLGTEYLDCLVLHSTYPDITDTIRVWKAMEALVPNQVGLLGVSDVDIPTLRTIVENATLKPAFVQNRFTKDTTINDSMPPGLPYPKSPYDRDVRTFCAECDITYNPWGVLWGNPELMETVTLHKSFLDSIGISTGVACLACVREAAGCKITILCGTTNVGRMKELVAGFEKIDRLSTDSPANKQRWCELVDVVSALINKD